MYLKKSFKEIKEFKYFQYSQRKRICSQSSHCFNFLQYPVNTLSLKRCSPPTGNDVQLHTPTPATSPPGYLFRKLNFCVEVWSVAFVSQTSVQTVLHILLLFHCVIVVLGDLKKHSKFKLKLVPWVAFRLSIMFCIDSLGFTGPLQLLIKTWKKSWKTFFL